MFSFNPAGLGDEDEDNFRKSLEASSSSSSSSDTPDITIVGEERPATSNKSKLPIKVLAFDVSGTLQALAGHDDQGRGMPAVDDHNKPIPDCYSVMIGGEDTAGYLREAQRWGIEIYLVTNNGEGYDKQVIDRTLNFLENYDVMIPRENYRGPRVDNFIDRISAFFKKPSSDKGDKVPRLMDILKENHISAEQMLFFDDVRAIVIDAKLNGFDNAIWVTAPKDLHEGIKAAIESNKFQSTHESLNSNLQNNENLQNSQMSVITSNQQQSTGAFVGNDLPQDNSAQPSGLPICSITGSVLLIGLGLGIIAASTTLLCLSFGAMLIPGSVGLGVGSALVVGGAAWLTYSVFTHCRKPRLADVEEGIAETSLLNSKPAR